MLGYHTTCFDARRSGSAEPFIMINVYFPPSVFAFRSNTRYSLRQLELWADEGHRKPLDDLFR